MSGESSEFTNPRYSERMVEANVTCRRDRGIDGYAGALGRDRESFLQLLQGSDPSVPRIIMDLGSGQGNFANEMRDIPIPNVTVVAVDLFPPSLENAVSAEFSNLPFATESIDTVLGIATVGMYAESEEHLKKNFREMARVMKPGGSAFIAINKDNNSLPIDTTQEPEMLMEAARKATYLVYPLSMFEPEGFRDIKCFRCNALQLLLDEGFELRGVSIPDKHLSLDSSITVEVVKMLRET